MYKLIGAMLLSAIIYMVIPVSKSEAGTKCTPPDIFGNQTCTDDSGRSVTKEKTNIFGDDVYRDNRTGKTTKCRKDIWGNYVCD